MVVVIQSSFFLKIIPDRFCCKSGIEQYIDRRTVDRQYRHPMNQKAKARLLEKEDPTGGTLPDMRRRNRGLIYVKNRCPMHISDNDNTHRHLVDDGARRNRRSAYRTRGT